MTSPLRRLLPVLYLVCGLAFVGQWFVTLPRPPFYRLAIGAALVIVGIARLAMTRVKRPTPESYSVTDDRE